MTIQTNNTNGVDAMTQEQEELYTSLVEEYGAELVDGLYDEIAYIEDCEELLKYNMIGLFRSFEEFARDYMHEGNEISENLAPYINYANFARDIEGDFISIPVYKGVYVLHAA